MENVHQHLKDLGLINVGKVYRNLPVVRLVEEALVRGEGVMASNGGLIVMTGDRTGRSPNDKFVVQNPDGESNKQVAWGKTNVPIEPRYFDRLRARQSSYLQRRDLFVLDAYVCADPKYQVSVRVITEFAWQALFARTMFRRVPEADLATFKPDWTVIGTPLLHSNPAVDGTRTKTAVTMDFEQNLVVILGSEYGGEIKKSIFTALNYRLPQLGVFPMHCSANVGDDGVSALFFGLSGTGKTTLSADPNRRLIGDDEHGWSDDGVFNFEGGCYAKCIRLSRETEPQIWDAIRFGSVVENVVYDADSRVIDFDSDGVTENTRVTYPLDHIDNVVPESAAGHPNAVIFLAADAFGVLPPISRLTPDQAMYHFLSGYTAKLAGTEAGVTEPQATFSACFGAPFLPLNPSVYANMLGEKLKAYGSTVYLLNTGWAGGRAGEADRIKLRYTRAMVTAALSGALSDAETVEDPVFGLHVPKHIEGVPDEIMRSRESWADPAKYDASAHELARLFNENFKKFDVPDNVKAAGPKA
ncbi:MAG: phosphoenolpyruvate carboxykinase (ATP) [Chloroflexaceae bacterium]|nr:phosphoenolpyruvate carboxykinase (ATP) [Chloroflexaceae bacterium]